MTPSSNQDHVNSFVDVLFAAGKPKRSPAFIEQERREWFRHHEELHMKSVMRDGKWCRRLFKLTGGPNGLSDEEVEAINATE